MREASGAQFEFLSDPEGRLLDALHVRHTGGGANGADIAQSSNFLISSDGELLWAHLSENYRTRVKPEVLLEVLASHLKK